MDEITFTIKVSLSGDISDEQAIENLKSCIAEQIDGIELVDELVMVTNVEVAEQKLP